MVRHWLELNHFGFHNSCFSLQIYWNVQTINCLKMCWLHAVNYIIYTLRKASNLILQLLFFIGQNGFTLFDYNFDLWLEVPEKFVNCIAFDTILFDSNGHFVVSRFHRRNLCFIDGSNHITSLYRSFARSLSEEWCENEMFLWQYLHVSHSRRREKEKTQFRAVQRKKIKAIDHRPFICLTYFTYSILNSTYKHYKVWMSRMI